MKKIYYYLFTISAILFFSNTLVFAQKNNLSKNKTQNFQKQLRKQQWQIDLIHSGIGIDFNQLNYGENVYKEKDWRGFQILMGPIVGGYSQGKVSVDYIENEFISEIPIRSSILNANRFYIGTYFPLNFLTIGQYKNYNRVFRGTPILLTTFSRTKFYDVNRQSSEFFSFNVTPGYRVRLPYGSIDFGFETKINFLKTGKYVLHPVKLFSYNPTITLRFDGMLQKFNPKTIIVDAYQYNVNSINSRENTYTQYNYDGSKTKITETTTTYQYTVTPTKSSITDIGKYLGIGIKISSNGIGTDDYQGKGILYGGQLLYRKSQFLFGFNMEYGTLGHGSSMIGAPEPKKHKRKVNNSIKSAKGEMKTFNTMIDLGFDLNRILLGLGGLLIEENNATPYISFNAGYSFGYSFISNQTFDNPTLAETYLSDLNVHTKFNDPTLNKSGYVGGFFVGTDIGAVTFRSTWYRYRNAPLANNINIALAWRFLSPTKK